MISGKIKLINTDAGKFLDNRMKKNLAQEIRRSW